MDAGVKKLKFVDRTFNLKPDRMKSLMEWLSQFIGSEFHFEVVGDILTPDILKFLEKASKKKFKMAHWSHFCVENFLSGPYMNTFAHFGPFLYLILYQNKVQKFTSIKPFESIEKRDWGDVY